MAAYFQLYRIGTSEAVTFEEVDRDLCQNLGFTYDPEHYAGRWYNTVGFALALGYSWDTIVDVYDMPQITAIVHHMRQLYNPDAWNGR